MQIEFRTLRGNIPDALANLQKSSLAEGHRFVKRFCDEWNDGTVRFDRPGERMVLAFKGDSLRGMGGITIDPLYPDALRMRRLYVSPDARGEGVGRGLVDEILKDVAPSTPVTVHAGNPDAILFWDAMRFPRSAKSGITHERPALTA